LGVFILKFKIRNVKFKMEEKTPEEFLNVKLKILVMS